MSDRYGTTIDPTVISGRTEGSVGSTRNTGTGAAISCVTLERLLKPRWRPVEIAPGNRRLNDAMHSERFRKTIRVAVLLALIGVLAAPRGLVLCVDDSGHVSIEAALEIVPCPPASDDPRFETEPAATCEEITLTREALKSPGELELVSASVAILAPPPQPPEVSQPSPPSATAPSASSLWLREHRTIVLLV